MDGLLNSVRLNLSREPEIHCSDRELRDPAALIAHPKNPNRHPAEQIRLLAKIINHQGWRNLIVVSARSGFVISVHGRLMAAKLLGATAVRVDVQEFATEADKWAPLVADNRIAELAELVADPTLGETDPDGVPETPTEPVTRPGDIWILGRPRRRFGIDPLGLAAIATPSSCKSTR